MQNIHWIVQNITSDKIVKRSETSAQNRKSLRKSGITLKVKILTMWHSYINDEELENKGNFIQREFNWTDIDVDDLSFRLRGLITTDTA